MLVKYLSVIPEHLSSIGFENSTPSMKIRYETFFQGNDYVGSNAASDDAFMDSIFNSLIKQSVNPREVQYVETW